MQRPLDTGHEVCMIFLDFSSTFDHVNHEALIFKLRQMAIGGTFLKIIVEFLTGENRGWSLMDNAVIIECNL